MPHFQEDDIAKHKTGTLLLEAAPQKGGYLETIPETRDPWDVTEVTLEPEAFIASERLADDNIACHLYFSNSIPPLEPTLPKPGKSPASISASSASSMQRPTTLNL